MAVTHKEGCLLIQIEPVNDSRSSNFLLLVPIGTIAFVVYLLLQASLRPGNSGLLICLPILTLIAFWCVEFSRSTLEAMCEVDLLLDDHKCRWTYRIRSWERHVECGIGDVTDVEERDRWYGNTISITMAGKTYSLGNLLDDDMKIIGRELRRAISRVSTKALSGASKNGG